MNKKELELRLTDINKGLTSLIDPESNLRRMLAETGRMDLLLSVDLHSLQMVQNYLSELEKENYHSFHYNKGGLSKYTPKDRIVSGVKEIWKTRTKYIRRKIKFAKMESRDLQNRMYNARWWYKLLYGFIHVVTFIPFILVLISSINTSNPVLVSIGLVLTAAFEIWHMLLLNNRIVWEDYR